MTKVFDKVNIGIIIFLLFFLSYCNYLIFVIAPNEKIMGAIQRIFYFHVGSAIASYVSFALVFVASILTLVKKQEIYNKLNIASGEVGFLFCSITLFSGMLWGHTAWNTWFRFEPRLVTFLLLWLIFLSFNLLRFFGGVQKISRHLAIIGILGAITVPIMVFSIKLLPAMQQLHPQVVDKPGGLDPMMQKTMFLTMLGLVLLQLVLVYTRFRIELIKEEKNG